jgi:hypothetical protein
MVVERPAVARSANIGAIVVALLVGCVMPAAGQAPAGPPASMPPVQATTTRKAEPRVFVTVGAGVQAAVRLTDRLEWEEHLETATAGVDYGPGAAPWFGGAVGVRLWRQFGGGVTVSRAGRRGTASVEARLPHPFHFAQPRDISGDSPSLARAETSLHFQVLYFVPSNGRTRITVSSGPSHVQVERDVVTAVRFTEEYPFDEALFQRADTLTRRASALGFNVGAEIAYMFRPAAGIAGGTRFSRATVDFARPDGSRFSVNTGGLQAGIGLRLGF